MTDENYWYGAPKAGEFVFEVDVFADRFKGAFKTITAGIEDAMREVMFNSTLTVLMRQLEENEHQQDLVYANNVGSWYDIRVGKYAELGEMIRAYTLVIQDIKKVRDEWMSKKSKT